VSDAIASLLTKPPSELVGVERRLEGRLIVTATTTETTVRLSLADRLLEVVDESLLDRLLDSVPAYVGGIFAYNDAIQVVCTLGERGGELVVTKVTTATLHRPHEGSYQVAN
jgi:hypothetical protein